MQTGTRPPIVPESRVLRLHNAPHRAMEVAAQSDPRLLGISRHECRENLLRHYVVEAPERPSKPRPHSTGTPNV